MAYIEPHYYCGLFWAILGNNIEEKKLCLTVYLIQYNFSLPLILIGFVVIIVIVVIVKGKEYYEDKER